MSTLVVGGCTRPWSMPIFSHFYHEKRVAGVSISTHTCDPVPIVMRLRVAALRAAGAPLIIYLRRRRIFSRFLPWGICNSINCSYVAVSIDVSASKTANFWLVSNISNTKDRIWSWPHFQTPERVAKYDPQGNVFEEIRGAFLSVWNIWIFSIETKTKAKTEIKVKSYKSMLKDQMSKHRNVHDSLHLNLMNY